jgi:DNA-binding transcriptional LysR family regulator
MNLDRLQAFVAFSEHLNFTLAAKQLHLSQPALHAQVGKLAEELGTSLYVRDGRALRLTREGIAVAAFGRDLTAQITAFRSRLQGQDAAALVTLAAGEGSFLYLLGPAVRAFTRQPPAPLHLMTADLSGVVEALRLGRAQLGVAASQEPPPDLDAVALTDVPPAVLLPAGHPLASSIDPLPLSALDGQRLIVPPRGRPHREAVSAALLEAGTRWEVAVEASGWELMRRFVGMGLGLAIVNGFCPPPPGGSSRPVIGLPDRRYWLLSRPHSQPSPATQALAALLIDNAEAWKEALSDA